MLLPCLLKSTRVPNMFVAPVYILHAPSVCLQADLFPGALVYFGSEVKTGFCLIPFIFMLILMMFLCITEECNETQQ